MPIETEDTSFAAKRRDFILCLIPCLIGLAAGLVIHFAPFPENSLSVAGHFVLLLTVPAGFAGSVPLFLAGIFQAAAVFTCGTIALRIWSKLKWPPSRRWIALIPAYLVSIAFTNLLIVLGVLLLLG